MAGKVNEGLIATIDSGAAGTVFAKNSARTFLSITNTHASQTLTVRFGATAAAGAGRVIAAGVTVTWGDNITNAVPGSSVSVIGSGSATTFYAFEHNGNMTGAESSTGGT